MTSSPSDAVEALAAVSDDLKTSQKIKILLGSVGRTLVGLLFIAVVLLMVPEKAHLHIWESVGAILLLIAVYGWYFRLQLRRIHQARYPQVQAAEALILVATVFLAIFAVIYNMMSLTDSTAFTETLDRFTAFYFAVTVLATVGFGDITPVTTSARSVVMVQMAIDIAFIAVAVKIFGGAATKAIQQRHLDSKSDVQMPE